jgi:hypothetical protein
MLTAKVIPNLETHFDFTRIGEILTLPRVVYPADERSAGHGSAQSRARRSFRSTETSSDAIPADRHRRLGF